MAGRIKISPDSKAALVERLRAGEALAVLAAEYGVSPTRLSQIGLAAGLQRRRAVADLAARERAAALYAAGARGNEIARETGLSFSTAKNLARKRALPRRHIIRITPPLSPAVPAAARRGRRLDLRTKNLRAALANGEIDRLMRVEGASVSVIADRYHVSYSTVFNALRGSGLASAAQAARREIRERQRAERAAKKEASQERIASRIARIAAGVARGETLTAIAHDLGLHLSYISRIAGAAGIKVSRSTDWENELARAVASQESAPELARRLKVTRSSVHLACRRLGVILPRKHGARAQQRQSTATVRAEKDRGLLRVGRSLIEPQDLASALRALGWQLRRIDD